MTRRKYSITVVGKIPSKLVERISMMHAFSIIHAKSIERADASDTKKNHVSPICTDIIETSIVVPELQEKSDRLNREFPK
jgi:hypothetical protein